MAGFATGYWMGKTSAENARLDRKMWDLASRAAGRPAPVNATTVLTNQVAQLQAQLQAALADNEWLETELHRVTDQCNNNYQAWLVESQAHRITQAELSIYL